MGKLREVGLFVKAEKCEFDVNEGEFLSFHVGVNCVLMEPSNSRCIVDWPIPRSVHDIQVFLVLMTLYRRFIHEESKPSVPLVRLLKKNASVD